MSMITVDMLKSTLNISSSAYDADLTRALCTARGFIESSVLMATTGGTITEWHPYNTDTRRLYITARGNDVSISSLVMIDSQGAATTAASGDYEQIGPSQWQMLPTAVYPDAVRYKISYTSSQINYAIDLMVRECAIYEFLKQPGQQGFMTRLSKTAGDTVSETYLSNEEFYAGIRRKIANLYVPAV